MAQVPATRRSQGGQMAARRDYPLTGLQRGFDTLLDRLWSNWLAPFDQDMGPMRLWDFDVKENDKEIIIRAEAPGFEPNEIDVQLNNNVLTISAQKEQKGDRQEEYLSFYRSITLPAGINPDKVQATYRNGVLELHIPRAEGAQPRHIQLQGQQAGSQAQGQQAGNQAGAATSAKGTK